MSTYLVTGAAGFIAARVCELLLEAGHTVVGVDNLNDYYDVRLKDYRLSKLLGAAGGALRPDGLGLGADPKKSVYAEAGLVLRNAPDSGSQGTALGTTRSIFEFHYLDIENLPALDAVFAAHKFEAVFNLAARAGVRYSIEFPELYRRTNVLGAENVLKCQVKYGVKKQVLASSSSVYAGCPMPFTENAVLGTMQSPYAETKRQAEQLAQDYHLKHGLDVTVLRYFTVFGPAGRPDMAPLRFIKWIDEGTPITLYGDGSQARDFTYVDDIARGTVLAAQLWGGQLRSGSQNGAPAYDLINLGGGNNPITLHTMIGWIERALENNAQSAKGISLGTLASFTAALGSQSSPHSPSPVKARISTQPASAADMAATWADIAKAKRLLGWAPQVPPEDGFRRTVNWHWENREWLKEIKL